MATFWRPSLTNRFDRTAPCRMSDGASRKYRSGSAKSPSSNAVDVLAGEYMTTPADMILSMTVSDTPDEAAPTMTSDPALISLSDSAGAMALSVSPESPRTVTTSLPSTPPASLMSLMARSTPANSGGPRKARLPVSGSKVPIVRVPSPLVVGSSPLGVSPESSLPQAASTSVLAAATAALRTRW